MILYYQKRGEAVGKCGKILDKMKRQPSGITPSEAQKVLETYGYRLDRQRGSHMQFINQQGDVITVKKENPLKVCYVKDILSRVL